MLKLFVSVVALAASFSVFSDEKYPGTPEVPCLSMPVEKESSAAYTEGQKKALEAMKKKFSDPGGIWDQTVLQARPPLLKTLEAYDSGEYASSIRDLKLAGKTPSQLHEELIKAGFSHKRISLNASNQDDHGQGRGRYWRQDGSKTSNPSDNSVIYMDIYLHEDGGVVRVKPSGVPDPRYPSPAPHASKSVVIKKNRSKKRVLLDSISWKDEAFKVTEDGVAVPKSPRYTSGLKRLFSKSDYEKNKNPKELKDQQRGWVDAIMQAAHPKIAVDFGKCIKEKAA